MRGLSLWMAIIAVVGLVLFPVPGAFGDDNIAKGPTPGGIYIIGPGHDYLYPVLYYSPDYGDTLIPMDSTEVLLLMQARGECIVCVEGEDCIIVRTMGIVLFIKDMRNLK